MSTTLMFLLVLVGLFVHFVKKWDEKNSECSAPDVSLPQWLRMRPYRTVASVLAALSTALVLHDVGELTMIAALGIGYASDSIADYIKARSLR